MRAVVTMVALVAAGCAGYAEASPEQVEQEERRLLQPFTGGSGVICDELVVEMTANFNENVARPAVDARMHQVQRSEGDGYAETQWVNLAGDTVGAFTVTIGEPDRFEDGGYVRGRETRFKVLRGLRVRVYEGRRTMSLQATASGNVVVVEGDQRRDLEEFRVEDGVLQVR